MHNETFSVVAMCVSNPDRLPVGIGKHLRMPLKEWKKHLPDGFEIMPLAVGLIDWLDRLTF